VEQRAYREQFELEDTHWWFAGRRAVIRALMTASGTPAGGRLLDAGCGTGHNLLEFGTSGSARGVDASPEAIEFCHRRGLTAVTQGRIEQLPFGDASFDLILATDVLEHLQDDRLAMRELRRVGAPGSRLLVTVPAYGWLWSRHDADHHHFRRYTLGRLSGRLEAAGWMPLTWSYFNTVLLAPIAAVRLAGRRLGRDGDRPDLRLTPPALNRLLEQPMRLEAAVIARGARLGAGVSIGIICRAGVR
jgi:SAM-dependent methyltransferase